jgi:Ca-activated chloride channel family protein
VLSHRSIADRSLQRDVPFLSRCPLLYQALLMFIVVSFCLLRPGFSQTHQTQLPYMNAGPNSAFAQVDFSEIYADSQVWDQGSIDSGNVSVLDMAAPEKAVQQFNHGITFLRAQNFKDAIKYLKKAVELYPKFVSAHIALGLAYLDQQDARAKEEFETAASLDDRFPSPFINLGMMALGASDFPAAEANFRKAASLSQGDVRLLTALAFAQNCDHNYQEALKTVERVHTREHHGLANAHYIGAAAAISLNDLDTARHELNELITEDPSNPLAPIARQKLEMLVAGNNLGTNSNPAPAEAPAPSIEPAPAAGTRLITFPNSEHLAAQLKTVGEDSDSDNCQTCNAPPAPRPKPDYVTYPSRESSAATFTTWDRLFTIHQAVDETALFFSVSHHGQTVNDLTLSDIQVRDDNKPPDKVLQFIPQSKLPLRLALLIDASDSVKRRLWFEKQAAQKFVRKVLTGDSDLGFIAGFNNEVFVTQDFTRDIAALDQGIEKLGNGGNGTSLFDAVFYACWKLAAYPDTGRVAKVLVILTDGEDNSSHRSLKQTIEEAEAAGVTVYTLSTSEVPEIHTDANRILKVLADRTGGESLMPEDLYALDHYLSRLPDVIRSRYLIAYRAADFQPDGRYRSIQVKAEKDGQSLRVHVRRGYYARLADQRELSMR